MYLAFKLLFGAVGYIVHRNCGTPCPTTPLCTTCLQTNCICKPVVVTNEEGKKGGVSRHQRVQSHKERHDPDRERQRYLTEQMYDVDFMIAPKKSHKAQYLSYEMDGFLAQLSDPTMVDKVRGRVWDHRGNAVIPKGVVNSLDEYEVILKKNKIQDAKDMILTPDTVKYATNNQWQQHPAVFNWY
jgi:hypothetical protein